MHSFEHDVKNKSKNMGVFPHSSYHLIGDLDIKSPNHILKCIISNVKSSKGMVFGSIRMLNTEIRLSLGQRGLSLDYYT